MRYEERFDQKSFEEFIQKRFPVDLYLNSEDGFLGDAILEGDNNRIGFFVIRVDDDKDIENARVAYNDQLRKYAQDKMLDSALGAFYNNRKAWRLSFVSFTYVDGKKTTVRSLKKSTFVLGIDKVKTARSQLSSLPDRVTTTDQLQKAFSVEAVSDEFFDEYRSLFEMVNAELLPQIAIFGNEENLHAFSKKLLGRIVFLYFLQKKGWLGVAKNSSWGDGDKDFISTLYRQNSQNFYDTTLLPLFFDSLNKERKDDYSEIFSSKIPFLNGGLFDKNPALDDAVIISDQLIGKVLEVFDSYNFTIIEDSEEESEVAIDPEMLGRVFENLLEENYRKGKGAFYTPREIVGYMCKEAIFHKLIDQGFDKIHIENLIHNNQTDNPYIIKNAQAIKRSILDLKVLDLAIGSGAFPMGMLQTMSEVLISLDKSTDRAKLKREIIENSIYGVDIDFDAVEIAKLRFWLSLTVEEDEPKPLPNLDFKIMQGNSLIETINGFSLVPQDIYTQTATKKASLFDDFEKTLFDQTLFEELTSKIHTFFASTDPTKKQHLKDEIRQQIKSILETYLKEQEEQFEAATTNQSLKSQQKNATKTAETALQNIAQAKQVLKEIINNNFQTKELFLYKLFFGEVLKDGGFDIVIGNPPYVRQEKIGEIKEKLQIEAYQTYAGTADLFVYFFEQGYRLLRDGGVLSFITSNKYTRANYGKNLRDFLLNNTELISYIDFDDVKVFKTATITTSILTFKKSKVEKNNLIYCIIDNTYQKDNLKFFIDAHSLSQPQNTLTSDSFIFANQKEFDIKTKLEKSGLLLKDWDILIKSGIKTGFNEAFIIDQSKKDELIKKDPKSIELIKPYLRGRDVERYKYNFQNLYLINSHNNPPVNIGEYPVIKNHLDNFFEEISKRSDKGQTPYNLRNCAFLEEFEKEKIFWIELSDQNKFAFDDQAFYVDMTIFFITGKSLKYLLALLNSKLVFWYFNLICAESGVGTNRWKKTYVEQIPIPQIPEADQKPFIDLVDQILALKADESDTTHLEREIDTMVYKLYDLTDEEIAIIETS